jgi:Nitroreductase family
VRAFLDTALAPRRWEPWADHNDHRAYPSARAAHLHTAALRVAGAQARTIDPVRGLLIGSDPAPRGSIERAGAVTVELTPAPHRLRPGYGSLRDAIALLETGHVAGALVESAGAHGLRAACTLRPDAATATGHGSGPVASVEVTPAPAPGSPTPWPRTRVMAVRTSGLAPRGLSADPRPLTGAAFDGFAAAAIRTPPGSPADPARSAVARRIRSRLLVRNVIGRVDGVHELAPTPVPVGGAPGADELRALFAVPPSGFDIPGLPIVWVITADVAGAVDDDGPQAYAALLLTAGAAAQHVCSAAAEHGLFCRPVRGVDDDAIAAAVGAAPGEDLLYVLLIGRPRLPAGGPALGYDLTDPDPYGDAT